MGQQKVSESNDIMVQESEESLADDSLGWTGQDIGRFGWRQLKCADGIMDARCPDGICNH